MESVIIIGGGAAGMAAAIAAASCGDSVLLLERMDRVGKKILATGNGRCNLMNTGAWRYPGGGELAKAVLTRIGPEEQTRFWQHFGLNLRQEDGGRVYPISGQASTVLDTLRMTMERLGVETLTGVQATAICKGRHSWTVMAGEQPYHRADRVIVAGGGCAQPKLGSDGSTWPLLTALGHHLVKPEPALSQIITDTAAIKGLSGIRIRSDIRITSGVQEKYRESGEVLFADYGVTGVCVMQCARYVSPGNVLHIDLAKAMGFGSADAMRQELLRRCRQWPGKLRYSDLMTGLCVSKMSMALLRGVGIDAERSIPAHPERDIERIVCFASDLSLTVKGVKGFDNAQVTAGGISADEFAPATMVSLFAPGIHAAGEVIDVDGDCGGFNLMFAFGSGILAGLNGRKAPW